MLDFGRLGESKYDGTSQISISPHRPPPSPNQDFAKPAIKSHGVAPDAFFQLALQLAYAREHGQLPVVYESASTRLFRDARTETIRSVTSASTAFLQVWASSFMC